MKEIKLTQGKVALVDDEDYEWLNQWKWYALKNGNTYYVTRAMYFPDIKKQKRIFMHRMIMNTPSGMYVDHIDFDGLNNQRINLRNCTPHQSCFNRRKRLNKTAKYLGVDIVINKCNKNVRMYIRSRISVNGKLIQLGNFKTEEDAARAYDNAALKYYGEFANLNFK